MMAAAQAAAEMALKEATATDQAQPAHHRPPVDEKLLRSMQMPDMDEQRLEVLKEMMTNPAPGGETAQQLLQLLTQQQEPTRPTEHYLTISQSGTYWSYSLVLFFWVDLLRELSNLTRFSVNRENT